MLFDMARRQFRLFGHVMDYFADLEDRDRRKDAHEDAHQEDEESHGPDKHRPIPNRGVILTPRRRYEIAMQAGDDDNKPLQPHADIHNDGFDEKQYYAFSNLAEPQELRQSNIAENQQVVERTVGAKSAIQIHEPLIFIAAVIGAECFHRVGVGDDHAGAEHELAHAVEV